MGHFSATEYYQELLDISASKIALKEKMVQLRRLFERACRQLSHEEQLTFPNFFSRLDYVGKKYALSSTLNRGLNAFRVRTNSVNRDQKTTSGDVEWSIKLLADLVYEVSQEPTPMALHDIFPTGTMRFATKSRFKGERLQRMRCHFSHSIDEALFYVFLDDDPTEAVRVKLMPDFDNRLYNSQLIARLPQGVSLNLIDTVFDEETASYLPEIVVFEPDFLLDISSVSECFRDWGKHPYNYILSRLELPSNSKYMVLGNLANGFLDAFVNRRPDEKIEYGSLMKKLFMQNPYEFATCLDIDDIESENQFFKDCALQFQNIELLVNDFFPKEAYKIDVSKAVLEPSFLCEILGLQGRLDLMLSDYSVFIELKSGKAKEFPPPTTHKENHYVQMMLYFAVLHYNMGIDVHKSQAYLMYSRYPMLYPERPYWSLVKAAIELRNKIVWNDYQIQQKNNINDTFEFLSGINAPVLNENSLNSRFWETYLKPNIDQFEKKWRQLNGLERSYFARLYNFITKEQFVSKTGAGSDYESQRGIFALWSNSLSEKLEIGEILYDLKLTSSSIDSEGHRIVFSIPEYEIDVLPNFRIGDIVLFYERNSHLDLAINRQVIKASIISIDVDEVVLQLRCPQPNQDVLPKKSLYAIERDAMDVSFTAMYKSLAAFMQANQERRDLLLNQRLPKHDEALLNSLKGNETDFERTALKALAAKDYFLLVGPPGTGKTSCALKLMVEAFYDQPQTNILLLAYTNKAVDEICRALEDIDPKIDYIRLGNKWSCEEQFLPNMFEAKLATSLNRNEVRSTLQKCQVYVSTVLGMTSKTGLFRLKTFDVAIVDEASQILEPQLLWLLCAKTPKGENAIGKFVLIGDHKQLPAVVAQSEKESKVMESELLEIGLLNLRESLFERLYRNVRQQNLKASFDMLSRQGRMHPDVVLFANKAFYQNLLEIVPTQHQKELLPYQNRGANAFSKLLASKRIHFFPTLSKSGNVSFKINLAEAKLTAKICTTIYNLYKLNDLPFSVNESIGVITPYRSQISAIKKELKATGIIELQSIVVDTVERFQGGQRDVIVFSFCVNKLHQLDFLPNISMEDGVKIDRKLNVALTRAKKQLFLLGNPEILDKNPIYKSLIDSII